MAMDSQDQFSPHYPLEKCTRQRLEERQRNTEIFPRHRDRDENSDCTECSPCPTRLASCCCTANCAIPALDFKTGVEDLAGRMMTAYSAHQHTILPSCDLKH